MPNLTQEQGVYALILYSQIIGIFIKQVLTNPSDDILSHCISVGFTPCVCNMTYVRVFDVLITTSLLIEMAHPLLFNCVYLRSSFVVGVC